MVTLEVIIHKKARYKSGFFVYQNYVFINV